MKALSLLSQKGGSGKSTLAVHLAVVAQASGRRVVIVDLDPQRSAAGWWDRRAAETPELVEGHASNLRTVLAAAKADGVGLCVIDTRPSAGFDIEVAAAVSDLVLIPTRPAVFDLTAIGATIDIVKAKVAAAVVLNGVPAGRGAGEASVTVDARRALAAYDVTIAPVAIGLRAALAHALIDGSAVNEFEPDGKAALEITRLWKLVEGKLWGSDHRSAR
jgi:chromosome partitioning protein